MTVTRKSLRRLLSRKGRNVWSIAPAATVYEAVEEMAERRVGALLVLDGERLVGIVSERDYARKVVLCDRSSRETHVEEIMTAPVVTVRPSATLQQCISLMTGKRFRHLPVVEDGKVVGVVSIGDLLRARLAESVRAVDQLERYICGH